MAYPDETVAAFVELHHQAILVSCDSYSGPPLTRHVDVGIREMTAVSTAAGLAAMGCRPVVLGPTVFLLTRAMAQLRQDVVHNNLPVILVGKASGASLRPMGQSHHLADDLLILRSLQPMEVHCPTSETELRGCLDSALNRLTPTFLRVGARYNPPEPTAAGDPMVLLVTAGDGVAPAWAARRHLAGHGVAMDVLVVHCLIPVADLTDYAPDTPIVVLEFDLVGLGDIVAASLGRRLPVFTWNPGQGSAGSLANLITFILQTLLSYWHEEKT